MWLDPPPLGLSEAERRVLEAFFVGQEAKRAAALLSLSIKTVNNELLSARQTMGENKSWVASIRYVFYVKRAGMGFCEPHLLPKIDKQIRRLLENYLDEQRPPAAAQADTAPTTCERPSLGGQAGNGIVGLFERSIAVFDPGPAASTEEFERELQQLTACAGLIYELPYERQRRRRRGYSVLALAVVASLVLTLFLVFKAVSTESVDTYPQIGERLDALSGASSADAAKERRELVIALSESYHRELWGPDEAAVIAIMTRHVQEIWAVVDSDPRAALVVLGNAHRAFKEMGEPHRSEWFERLARAIEANGDTTDRYMVRALCGYVLGALNDGSRVYKDPSPEEQAGLARGRAEAARRALEIVDHADVADHAEAIRHLAMISPPTRRLELCEEAFRLYGRVEGLRGKRGQAQCLLSIAQIGAGEGSEVMLDRVVKAFDAALPLGNAIVIRECIREMTQSLPAVPGAARNKEILIQVRDRLSTWADTGSGIESEKALLLSWCLEIDARFNRKMVVDDLERLIHRTYLFNREQGGKLAGFIFAECRRTGRPLKNYIARAAEGSPGKEQAFAAGQKMSMSEAVSIVTPPRLGKDPN